MISLPSWFLGLGIAIAAGSMAAAIARPAIGQETDTLPSEEDRGKLDFFESRIRPVLIEHCYECHGPDAVIAQGNLRLDARDFWLQGGDSGPAVAPGDPQASLLLQAIRYDGLEMPPKGKLSDAIATDFERWISDGAVDPRESSARPRGSPIDPVAAQTHWAFQSLPPQSPTPSIDFWIRDALESEGLPMAPPADPLVLLRRATLDLTGLPPTIDEIDSFLADGSPDRYERLVDRLLASPQYGVRWGRHWLDTVRYADSNGADENHDMPNAWRYRDWVVEALNEDLPFDAFVVQQLAGDLLPMPEGERERGRLLTATGYWVLGPKMLAEQDKEKMRIDIVDEQIDTLSRGLMGITLSCARCHDHKFDPFTQEDYYAVAGILMSTRAMENEKFVSQWMERPLPSAAIEAKRAAHQAQVAEASGRLAQAKAEIPEGKEPSAEQKQAIDQLAKEVESLEKSMPSFEMVMAVEEGKIANLPIHIRGNHLRPGEQPLPRGVPRILVRHRAMESIPDHASGRLQLARWMTHPDHPLLARVMVNRIWAWHFGQGLVASPSNFGLRGDPPSHPELLDGLSRAWIDQGWSMKWLHRQIMLSDTYRMQSSYGAVSPRDPENRFLSQRRPRRMEVEALRDAILSTSGLLDLRLGGPGQPLASNKRSIYLTINRAALADLFSVFDYVDPASHMEQRPVTQVPSQALFLMNSQWVQQAGQAIARDVAAQTQDQSGQIERSYLQMLGRRPSPFERERSASLLELIGKHDPQPEAPLAALVRSLIATQEFVSIE
ncbi:MAG: PSD1 and planctomycete cytochrome C domain-containing protein [Planctomycetota bacterium]